MRIGNLSSMLAQLYTSIYGTSNTATVSCSDERTVCPGTCVSTIPSACTPDSEAVAIPISLHLDGRLLPQTASKGGRFKNRLILVNRERELSGCWSTQQPRWNG